MNSHRCRGAKKKPTRQNTLKVFHRVGLGERQEKAYPSKPDAQAKDVRHPAAKPLLDAWGKYGSEIAPRSHLREYLREKFFADVHRQMYENRPIHWPLSSEKKTFVAWITIHRWTESTLRVLLADHLSPTLTRLDGELTDLRAARDGADKKAAKDAEKRFGDVVKARDELAAFIKQVEQCAEKGPPPTDTACPPREVDARYAPAADLFADEDEVADEESGDIETEEADE